LTADCFDSGALRRALSAVLKAPEAPEFVHRAEKFARLFEPEPFQRAVLTPFQRDKESIASRP
jgi:hypothetical protein